MPLDIRETAILVIFVILNLDIDHSLLPSPSIMKIMPKRITHNTKPIKCGIAHTSMAGGSKIDISIWVLAALLNWPL